MHCGQRGTVLQGPSFRGPSFSWCRWVWALVKGQDSALMRMTLASGHVVSVSYLHVLGDRLQAEQPPAPKSTVLH